MKKRRIRRVIRERKANLRKRAFYTQVADRLIYAFFGRGKITMTREEVKAEISSAITSVATDCHGG